MLKIFEDHVLREGRSRITVGAYSPFYLYPGIDVRYPKAVSFFKKHGYESVSGAVSMRMDFVDYVYPIVCKDSQGKIIAYAKRGIDDDPSRLGLLV